MSFAKLDSGIVNSTLWVQPHDVLRVWIWFLSQADANGVVRTAAPALAHACMIPLDRTREILVLLESPDPDSRSTVDDGRRIEKVDGGWQIVNYRAYRERVSADEKRENDRIRIAEKRAAERAEGQPKGECRNLSQPVASVVNVAQAEAEEEADIPPSLRSGGGAAPKPAPPPAITLPLNTGAEFPITAAQVREFTDLYPAADVMAELRKMRGWLIANPANRKTKAGVLRFVTRWLGKEQDKGAPTAQPRAGPNGQPSSRRVAAIETLMRGTTDGQSGLAEQRTAPGAGAALLLEPGGYARG